MATITEKRNKAGEIVGYKVKICLGRDAQYRQIQRVTTIQRPKGFTPVKERKEVQRLVDEWERKQKEDYAKTQSTTNRETITLAKFVEEHWWPDHILDGEHTPSTIQFQEYMSHDILNYFGPRKKLRAIDVEQVKRYIKWLRTEARTKKGAPYSAATIQHHFATLRNILEYARRLHYIPFDPCQDLSAKEKPQREKKGIDFLNQQQAKRFLECLQNEPLFWQAFENILLICGLRRGECVGLQWGDFDPQEQTITIRRNVTLDKSSPKKYHIGQTKTKEMRTVPVSDRVCALLRKYHAEQTARYGRTLPTAFIFNSPTNVYEPVYPTEPTRWQRRFVQKNGLPNVSPHDLRHTAATLALEGGANLKQIQELLGHHDPSTTMQFYAGVSEDAQRRTVEGIEQLLEGNR